MGPNDKASQKKSIFTTSKDDPFKDIRLRNEPKPLKKSGLCAICGDDDHDLKSCFERPPLRKLGMKTRVVSDVDVDEENRQKNRNAHERKSVDNELRIESGRDRGNIAYYLKKEETDVGEASLDVGANVLAWERGVATKAPPGGTAIDLNKVGDVGGGAPTKQDADGAEQKLEDE